MNTGKGISTIRIVTHAIVFISRHDVTNVSILTLSRNNDFYLRYCSIQDYSGWYLNTWQNCHSLARIHKSKRTRYSSTEAWLNHSLDKFRKKNIRTYLPRNLKVLTQSHQDVWMLG